MGAVRDLKHLYKLEVADKNRLRFPRRRWCFLANYS